MKMKILLKAAIVLLGIYTYLLSLSSLTNIHKAQIIYTGVINNQGYNIRQAKNIVLTLQNTESLSFVFWRSDNNVPIRNDLLGSTCNVEFIQYIGYANLLYTECPSIFNDDMAGCFVDEKVADELFGNKNIINNEIIIDNRSYVIRDVIEGKSGVFMCQARNNINLNRFSLLNNKWRTSNEIEEELILQYGINGELVYIEMLYFLSSILVLIIPIGLTIYFLQNIITILRQSKKRIREILIWMLFLGIGLLVLWRIVFINTVIPSEFIVKEMSNYEEWRHLFDEIDHKLQILLQTERVSILMQYWRWFYKICIYLGISLLCFISLLFSKNIRRIDNEKERL